jgi:hypothetical protein
MGMCADDSDRGKKLKKQWNAHIKVVNRTEERISVAMHFNDILEGELAIEPGQIGRLPLPTEVNFERDYPLNHILNDRRIDIRFADESVVKYNCGQLNAGLHKGDLIVDADKSLTSCEELNDTTLTPEQAADGVGMRDFMAEAGDPLCIPLSDETATKIQALIDRCIPAGAKTE